MLNFELINTLYEGLSREQKQELIGLLFKKSKQSISYFRRSKDISLSKLEIIADYFQMPLDYFRDDCSFQTNNLRSDGKYVNIATTTTGLMIENVFLRKEVLGLKTTIEAKNQTIETMKKLNDALESKFAQ